MKHKFLFSVIILLVTSSITYSQNPHFVRDSAWIPVMTGNGDWYFINQQHHYDSMKIMGVDYFFNNVTDVINLGSAQMNLVKNKGFKILPADVTSDNVLYNWLQYYCDAKYTVWEAEGTDTTNVGKATLERDLKRTEIIPGESIVRINPQYAGSVIDSLIYGPYYWQEVNYRVTRPGDPDTLKYDAEFRLKLEKNSSYPWHDTTSENLNAPLCIIKVTQCSINNSWLVDSIIVIDSLLLTRGDFYMLDSFYTKTIKYNLKNGLTETATLNCPMYYSGLNKNIMLRKLRKNIEFKVIWLGNPKYLLSVDKITVSDQRGKDLVADSSGTGIRLRIEQQLIQLNNYRNYVIGQYGIDEPVSIDNFKPIGIVAQTLRNHGHQLYLNFMGFWDGVWDNVKNPYGTNHLSPYTEFKMRTNGLVNIWATPQLYDVPFNDTIPLTWQFTSQGYTDWRLVNIDIAAKNCKWASGIDSLFGVVLQVSAQKNDQANLRDPKPYEILYLANLSLMHGAKFFDIYTYFTQNQTGIGTTTGIVGPNHEYTPKWFMWRDTLKPRLKGLFGKTLRNLKPDKQFVGSNGISYTGIAPPSNSANGFEYLEDIYPQTQTIREYGLDMGFFNDPHDAEKKYFIILNRYYSAADIFYIKVKNLEDFINWKLTNYVDATSLTLVASNEKATFLDTLYNGDANLYSILPVVKYGGKLIADDNAGEGMTLSDDMTIENGATLYVYGVYNANADITIKPGGKIVSGENGKIIFSNSHQLIIEGTAQINGSSNNRLEIVFKGQNAGGIKIKPNGTLKAFYCDIIGTEGAMNGITSESPTRSVTIENVSINGFGEYGISLQGSFGESIPDVTPTIKNCAITNCGFGISAANFYEFVILENTITSCKLGIFTSHVPAVFIVGNNITYSTTPELPGIFMLSSNGNVRANTVRGHTNGIYLAYSSPNIGGNVLEHNSEHGMFVDIGSVPNLVRGLAGPLPLVIATSGYNIIKENGIGGFGPMNGDGSEIFLRESNILLDYGCNQIIDDRQPISEFLLLMNGYINDESEIKANYNYWGIREPYAERFGDLSVYFMEFNPTPYNSGPCTTPQGACEELMERTSRGELISEVEIKNCDPQQLSELEIKYSEADMLYLTGEVNEAKTAYQ